MIEVIIDPQALEIHMQGHANYAEHGQDIVCAAASILVLTLAWRCKNIAEPGEIAEERLHSGDAHVIITPKKGREALFSEPFYTIMAGFEALSSKYPRYVRLSH